MAEEKPWAPLADAISDLWDSFLGASDDTCLNLFCESYTDERIPKSFLEKFLSKLNTETEAAKWTRKEDPDCKIPRDVMKAVFQATKKKQRRNLSQKNKKKKVADDEKNDKVADDKKNDKVADDKQKEKVEEIVKEELTDEQVDVNRKEFLKKADRRKEVVNKSKEVRGEKNREKKLNQKLEKQLVMINNTDSVPY